MYNLNHIDSLFASRLGRLRDMRLRRDRRNLYHTLAYHTNDAAGPNTLLDTAAVTDPTFSTRNNHFIFSEPYNILGAYVLGAAVSDAEIQSPSINAYSLHHLHGINVFATPTAPHVYDDYRAWPFPIPQNEEIQSKVTDTGNSHLMTFLHISDSRWSRTLPSGYTRMLLKATASVTLGAFAWGAFTALTFEQSPKGGWWTCIGARVTGTNLIAAQLNFLRQPLTQGRKFFPAIITEPVGTLPIFYDDSFLGPLGTWHTFEPPQMSGFGTAAGAQTLTLLMDCIFHGDNPPAGTTSAPGV